MNDNLIQILYVDDNPLDIELVRAALEREGGFQITSATNQAAFEAHMEKGKFDLVITDFDILGYDGLQVLDTVKEINSQIPVVLVTGTGSEEVAVEAMQRGAADYVIKTPHHIRRLPQTLLNVLEKSRLEQAHQQEQVDLQRKNAELELLHNLNQAVNRGDDLAQIFDALSVECKRIIDCFGVTIYLLSEDRQELEMQFPGLDKKQINRIEKLIRRSIPAVRIPKREGSWYWEVIETGQSAMTHDEETIQTIMGELTESKALKKLIPKVARTLGLNSVITTPLTADGEIQGIIDTSRKTPFSQEDLQWMEHTAGEVTSILKRKSLEDDLRAAQLRYQQAEKTAHLGYWEMDIASGKSIWSDEFFRICGLEPGSIEPSAEIGKEIIHPKDRDRAAEALNRAIETGQLYDIEKRITRPDGEVRHIHAIGKIIYDSNQSPLKLRGSFQDITEQVQAEDGKVRAHRMLLALSNAAQAVQRAQTPFR